MRSEHARGGGVANALAAQLHPSSNSDSYVHALDTPAFLESWKAAGKAAWEIFHVDLDASADLKSSPEETSRFSIAAQDE